MLAFYYVVNYIHQLTASVAQIFHHGYSRGKLVHFRQGKLAHLFSIVEIVKVSIQYFIATLD